MLSKSKQFIIEYIKWIKAGRPVRSKERTEEIFNICGSCENYKKDNDHAGNCEICGCRLTRNIEFWSKNSWATTNCPLDTPKWFADKVSREEPTEQEIVDMTNNHIEEAMPPQNEPDCGCGGKR